MKTISGSSVMVAEVQASLETLRAEAVAPAGLAGVKQVVGQRFSIWRPRERPEGEWVAFWSDYEAVLGDLPRSSLEAGMRAWIKGGATRLPYPGELLPLAKASATPEAVAYAKALKVIASSPAPEDQRARTTVDPVVTALSLASFKHAVASGNDPGHRGRMRRPDWMSDAQWDAAQKPIPAASRPAPPPISAHVGETGVSAELLDQLYGTPADEEVSA